MNSPTVMKSVTVASLAMPIWLPSLKEISEAAGIVTPILIAAFWILQVLLKVRAYRKGRGS